MANEWSKVEYYGANNGGQIVRYAIANDASVSKGAMLQLLDARTVSCAHLAKKHFRIAAEEHLPNRGVTSIGCVTQARMRFVASAAITVGDALATAEFGSLNHASSCGITVSQNDHTGVFSEDTLACGETGTARINQ